MSLSIFNRFHAYGLLMLSCKYPVVTRDNFRDIYKAALFTRFNKVYTYCRNIMIYRY